jgi:hypothetical protein
LNIIRNSGHFWTVRAENVSKVFDAGVGDAHRRRNTGWKNQVGEGERERGSIHWNKESQWGKEPDGNMGF